MPFVGAVLPPSLPDFWRNLGTLRQRGIAWIISAARPETVIASDSFFIDIAAQARDG